MNSKNAAFALGMAFALLSTSAFSAGPSTDIKTEYLMTLTAQLDAGQVINNNLFIYNVPSGTVEGPKIKGKILPPAADWLAVMPSGVYRLDVRLTILIDDNQYIYVTYNGIIKPDPAAGKKFEEGKEVIKAGEQYFITAPTFQTASPKYAWLNEIQAVGKQIALKGGDGSFVQYDLFFVR